MKKRKRKSIPLQQRLAAALVELLASAELRNVLREARTPARTIIGMFHFDHGHLHALDGSDKWWNLWPMTVAAHKQKSRRDTSIVAKVRRIEKEPEKWRDLTGPKITQRKVDAAVRRAVRRAATRKKIRSRGFARWPDDCECTARERRTCQHRCRPTYEARR